LLRPLALTGMSKESVKRPEGAPGNDMISMGVGIGAIGVAGAVFLGAACPVCVVATPALIGVGLFQKWRARRLASPFEALQAPGADRASSAQTAPSAPHAIAELPGPGERSGNR
jgi:hypothetical protein